MIRVLIADDQALIRESLEMMLNLKQDIRVVGTAKDGNEALRMAQELSPDVLLLDMQMPTSDGLTCLEKVRDHFPSIQVIVLSTFNYDEYVFAALRQGARGYLLKTIPSEELAAAIRKVYSGGVLMSPEVTTKVFEKFSQETEPKVKEVIRTILNKSETKIVGLIGAGFSNKEITAKLSLSEGTVRNYISSVLVKLDLRDRTQIAIWAVKQGIGAHFEDDSLRK